MLAELAGEKVAVTPAGRFEAAKLTAEAKPLAGATLMASVPLDPRFTATLVAALDRLKDAPAVITRDTLVVAVTPPPVPVMVSG